MWLAFDFKTWLSLKTKTAGITCENLFLPKDHSHFHFFSIKNKDACVAEMLKRQ